MSQDSGQKESMEIRLPELSPFIAQKKNQLSGKCTLGAWLLMLLGLLVSPFTTIFSVLLYMVPLYAAIFMMLFVFLFSPGCLGWIALTLISLFVVCFLSVFALFIVGIPVGFIQSSLARLGRCRNPWAGAAMGGLAGALGISPLFLAMLLDSSMPDSSRLPILLSFCFVSLISASGGALGGFWGIKQAAFCETCGTWYGKWSSETRLGLDAVGPLAAALNRAETAAPSPMATSQGKTFNAQAAVPPGSALIIQTRRCPKCAESNVQWHAFLRLSTGEKPGGFIEFVCQSMLFPLKVVAGEKRILTLMTNRHKLFRFLSRLIHSIVPAGEKQVEWFDVMLPPEQSHEMERDFFGAPPIPPLVRPPAIPPAG